MTRPEGAIQSLLTVSQPPVRFFREWQRKTKSPWPTASLYIISELLRKVLHTQYTSVHIFEYSHRTYLIIIVYMADWQAFVPHPLRFGYHFVSVYYHLKEHYVNVSDFFKTTLTTLYIHRIIEFSKTLISNHFLLGLWISKKCQDVSLHSEKKWFV